MTLILPPLCFLNVYYPPEVRKGSEGREVLGVGGIPDVVLPSCQDMRTIFFLYRRSSAMTSWSSTQILFWIIGAPSVIPTSIFVSGSSWI